MPVYTVQGKFHRSGRRQHKTVVKAVHEFYETPCDWQHLKDILLDAARRIYHEHGHQLETEVTIYKNLPGKYISGMVSYRQSRIHYQQEPIFMAKITYNPRMDGVKVEKATFLSPESWSMRDDYRVERGQKWQIPKVVPDGFEKQLHDPNIIFKDLNSVKNLSYAATPENSYASYEEKHHQQGMYAGRVEGLYAGSRQTRERDESEKESEH